MTIFSSAQAVLGINRRNIDFIAQYNPRRFYPVADDKLLTKQALERAGIPHPRLLRSYSAFMDLRGFSRDIMQWPEFVMKPARGLAGGGIMVLKRTPNGKFSSLTESLYSADELYHHATDILYGVYSIDNTTDRLLVEERIRQHSLFNTIYPSGIADVRIIVFRAIAVMAMTRIPTRRSQGKANLSLGAVGAGIDLESGRIVHAITKKGDIDNHPDTGVPLKGMTIPYWKDIMAIARSIQRHIPLGYLGIDFVIEENRGPLVMEVNTRPGLEIQNANRRGLREALMATLPKEPKTSGELAHAPS
jgi:alpha-L-glutamate ligase-like protein